MKSSSAERDEFQLLLENWQGSSIPDRGGKIIPPSRNGEWECSGRVIFEPLCMVPQGVAH